jgi:formamidopyrimidine-DNA glycosylase
VPELPEVETIVRELAPRLAGRTIRRAALAWTDVLRGVSKPRLLRTLTGSRITAVTRRAKHAVFQLSRGPRMVIQPRMTGSLTTTDRTLTAAERRYAVLTCRLDDGRLFVFRDVRRLGTIALLDDRGWAAYSSRLGPEPLDPGFAPAVFTERLRGTRAAVKKAIMDQRRVVGVGNIYANEALFDAGIDPSKPAHRLSPAELERLYHAIRDVLARAIASSGTTVRDYRTGTGEPGSFQFELRVYDRAGEPCGRCGRRLVTTHAIDGRQTTMCWNCQR